jgi:hypothetical protein
VSASAKIRRAPVRLATGAFILWSGVGHLNPDEQTVAEVHGMAAVAYPFLSKVHPKLFTRALAVGELATGGLLLVPIVPAWLAGLALTNLAGGLVGLYARTPNLHRERSVFPTREGLGNAKDTWLAAIGVSLLTDGVLAKSRS